MNFPAGGFIAGLRVLAVSSAPFGMVEAAVKSTDIPSPQPPVPSARPTGRKAQLSGVIAVVGCDGSGKTTLTTDLLAALSGERPVEFIYLGQSSGAIADWIRALPLIGPPFGRFLVRRAQRAHGQKSADPDALTALVIHLLSHWRAHKFRRLLRRSRAGVAVLTDRYPQAEVAGFYFDGPGLDGALAQTRWLRWLARREQRLYQDMAGYLPSLIIRLNIDADTAHARKPDHTLAMLRAKVAVIPGLQFNGATLLDLDGRSPYPEVLAAALRAARQALADSGR